jgi:protein phosphatase
MQEQPSKPVSQIRTLAVKMTHVGQVRDHNEDSVAIKIPSNEILQAKGSLNLVTDGMGGHQAGEVASQRAAEVVIEEYYADPNTDIAASLSRAMRRANSTVYEMAQSNLQRAGMGTTAVAAAVRGSEVHIANVGDSRAYVMRKGELIQITKDHSFVQDQIDANILTPETARTHPKRNVITRALGHKAQVDVDTFEGQLAPGELLLLCSDGLSGTLDDNDMLAILSHVPPQEAIMRLMNEANLRGGPDNVSAVIVQALPYDPALPAAIEVTPGVKPTPAMTEKPPAVAPARTKGGRGRFVVLGVAALVLLASLMAGAFLIFGGSDDDQAPTLTLVSPLTPDAGTTPTVVPPSSTPVGTPEETDSASTSPGTPGEPDVTSTPSGAPGQSDSAPTTTVAQSIPSTSTALPSSSEPEPSQTPSPQAVAPELVTPEQGRDSQNPITFRWRGPLQVGQAFQVTARHVDSGATVQSDLLRDLTWIKDLPAQRHGEWRWTVSLMDGSNTLSTSSEGMFWFTPFSNNGQQDTPQSATPEPNSGSSRMPRV